MPRFRISRLHRLKGEVLENGCRFVECLAAGRIGDVDATFISIPEGGATRPHRHAASHCFVFVVEGSAVAMLDGERRRVSLNDFIEISPGVAHGFEAQGGPVTLLSIHSPALVGRRSIDLEYAPREIPRRSDAALKSGRRRA